MCRRHSAQRIANNIHNMQMTVFRLKRRPEEPSDSPRHRTNGHDAVSAVRSF